jgi:WD40 repeat protein
LNADTGEVIQHFVGHTDRVTSAVLSLDGRRVLTASFDGTARLWDTQTGKELATLVSFTDSGWAVVDPAGHYDGSDPDNSDSMYWVTDNLRTIDLGLLDARSARTCHARREIAGRNRYGSCRVAPDSVHGG